MKHILLFLLAALASPALAQTVPSQTFAAPAVAGGYVLSSTSAYLTGYNVTSGASAGYVMLFDATAVPADGAVTPARCLPLAASTGLERDYRAGPLWFKNGVVIVFSTTGCFTKTASATAYIAGDYR